MTCAEMYTRVIETVGMLATLGGTVVALYYSNKAVRSAEAARLAGLSDSTIEIMNLFYKSRALFAKAKAAQAARNQDNLNALVPKAQLNLGILQLVVARPTLTDGGIAVGIGSIQLLEAILAQADEWARLAAEADPVQMMPDHLEAVHDILEEVIKRAEGVDAYAIKYEWPKWNERMQRIKSGN